VDWGIGGIILTSDAYSNVASYCRRLLLFTVMWC